MNDMTEFLGQWEVVSGRLGTETIPLPATTLILRRESYRVESPQGVDEGRASWSEARGHTTLDLNGTGGSHAGQTIAAIARVRGRVLQLCYAVDGSGRPTAFEAPAGAAWVTVRYRRVGAAG